VKYKLNKEKKKERKTRTIGNKKKNSTVINLPP